MMNKNKEQSFFMKNYLLIICVILVTIILLLPIIIVIISSFSSDAYAVFPPKGFSLRWYVNFFNSFEFKNSLKNSLVVSISVVFLSLTLGTLVSIALVRYKFPGKNIALSFFVMPIMFPAVILSLAFLVYFISYIKIHGTYTALILAHTVLTTPFVVRTVSSVLYGFNIATEEAAQSLGANRIRSFFSITLPQIKFGLITAAVFAFIISFDEVVISLLLVGAKTKTLPVYIFNYLEYTSDPTIAAVSVILISITSTIIALIPTKFLISFGGGSVK